MVKYRRLGQIFYGISIAAYGLQQIVVGDFRPAIVPEWPLWPHNAPVLVYAIGAALVVMGLILTGLFNTSQKVLRNISIFLGVFFLMLILFFHIPNRFFVSPNSPKHLGLWTDALKELAFSGGAFVMAGSFTSNAGNGYHEIPGTFSEKLFFLGRVFFSTMLIAFGFDHFYYTEFVATLVPAWFGIPVFWTYVAAVALIGAGTAIIIGIMPKIVSLLLAATLFIWFVTLHVPRAITTPYAAHGNEIVSAFDALLFCGVALIIASTFDQNMRKQQKQNGAIRITIP